MENQAEVLTAEELIASISQQAPSDTSSEVLVFTADDVAKAREQEKAKLYPQMEKMKAELAALNKAREDEVAKKAERDAKRAAEAAEKVAKQKTEEEQELASRNSSLRRSKNFSLS